MSSSNEKPAPKKYLYYDYHNGNIARERVGNNAFPMNRFEFYRRNGVWLNDCNLSLSLSDATMDFDGFSVFDYEELTEEEAMRRVAEIEKKYAKAD